MNIQKFKVDIIWINDILQNPKTLNLFKSMKNFIKVWRECIIIEKELKNDWIIFIANINKLLNINILVIACVKNLNITNSLKI